MTSMMSGCLPFANPPWERICFIGEDGLNLRKGLIEEAAVRITEFLNQWGEAICGIMRELECEGERDSS